MYIFRLCNGVKGYRLWCSNPKSPKFIISRDVIFNETTMLHLKKESSTVSDAGGVENVDHHIELEVENVHLIQYKDVHTLEPLDEGTEPEEERPRRP